MRLATGCLALLLFVASAPAATPTLPRVAPEKIGCDARKLGKIDELVAAALNNQQMPGCVVLVARHGKIGWLKVYGQASAEPGFEPLSESTIFDLASLTKPIATATSVMKLVEDGKVEISAPVAKYLPEFAQQGKEAITVEQLLCHTSGLIADNPIGDYNDGPEKAWERLFALKLTTPIGTKFTYSDVNFEILGKLVERVSGENLNTFARTKLYQPLGMEHTTYLPPADWKKRIAPTEKRGEQWLQGEVHDPRAYKLGGVAGHAGLFSQVDDLARYAQMLLGGGEYAGQRVLKPETIAEMTKARDIPGGGQRALGWDVRTGFSSNRGRGLSDKAFGHGGFTGTVIWIDPELDMFYIFLSNRVHPSGKGNVNKLAGEIGSVVVESLLK